MSPVVFILCSLVITSATLCIVFFVAWRTLGRMPHALTWSVAFALATVQWSVNLANGWFASRDVYWVVVSAITLAVITLSLLGHLQRVGRRVHPAALLAPPALCFLAIWYFTSVQPHAGLRMALSPAYGAVVMLLCALLIVRHRPRTLPAEWGAAIALGLFAATQVVAAGAAVMQGPALDATFLQIYQAVNFALLPGAYTGAGMFVVFMLASDLSIEMRATAVRDQLTGVLNRRGFCERTPEVYAGARRAGRPVSVVMTDIDFFKKVNDNYGHMTGDDALVHFAGLLGERARRDDIVARMGGEEFALILPGCHLDMAVAIAHEICARVRERPMSTDRGELVMTASFGVATLNDDDTCLTDAIIRADGALYQAKHRGRNRVEVELTQRSGDTVRLEA